MRNSVSRLLTASMIASAALMVSACGGNNDTTADTNMTEVNAAEPAMDGTMNDVTAVDAAGMGAEDNMAMGNDMMGADNGAMMSDNAATVNAM